MSAVSNGEKLGRDTGLVARDEVKEVNNCFMFKCSYYNDHIVPLLENNYQ